MTALSFTVPGRVRLGLVLAGSVVALVLAGLMAREFLSVDALLDSRDRLRAAIESRPNVAMGSFVVIYFMTAALSVPGVALLTLLGGFLFGPVPGATMSILAATAGSICVFALVRTTLGERVRQRADGRIASVAAGLRRDAVSYLLCARLMPLVPFWLVNVVAGASRVPLRTFVLASVTGMSPMKFALAFAGAALDEVAAGRLKGLAECRAAAADCPGDLTVGSLLTPQMISALAALALLALVPVALRCLRVHLRSRMLEGHAR